MTTGEPMLWTFPAELAVEADDDGTFRISVNSARGTLPTGLFSSDAELDVLNDDDGMGTRVLEWWFDKNGNGLETVIVAKGLQLPGLDSLLALRDRLTKEQT